MFVIFGFKNVTYTKESSTFYCPACRCDTPYAHKRIRRFFELYFVPIIPLDLQAEYVECSRCTECFDLKVLEHAARLDPALLRTEAVLRVMLWTAIADGPVKTSELEAVRKAFVQLDLEPPAEEAMRVEISGLNRLAVDAGLSRLESFDATRRPMLLELAALVAASDGPVRHEELAFLRRIAGQLEIPSEDVARIFASMAFVC